MSRPRRTARAEAPASRRGRGFRTLLWRTVTEAERHLAGDLGPEAVHRARLALKRARALARVGAAWADREAVAFMDEARGVLRALGARRDAEVRRRTALRLGRSAPADVRAGLRALADRTRAGRLGSSGGGAGELLAAARRLQAMAKRWPPTPPGGLAAGIAGVVRRARRGWKRSRGARDGRRRHQWRRREKERLHVAQLLARAWPADVPRRRRLNRRLDAALGEERDLRLLGRRRLPGASPETSRSGRSLLRARIDRLRRRADALGERLHAHRA